MLQNSQASSPASGPSVDRRVTSLSPFPGVDYRSRDILLVEDDPSLRMLLRQALHRAGYSVHEAGNGREALAYLVGHRSRLILTDLFMPEADGFELLTRLLLTHPRPAIIAMSGNPNGEAESFLEMARHLGATRTFAKPFVLNELLAAVDEVMKTPESGPVSVGLQAEDVGKILTGM